MREDKGGSKLVNYPAIKLERRTGSECLVNANNVPISTLQDFWSWAYSDLISNTERGVFAEYLVACALGINHKTRISWDPFDLFCPEDSIVDGRKDHSETIQKGIRIEIKAAGYIQTWDQKKLSAINFSIRKAKKLDVKSGMYDGEAKRWSDVYVFCLHKHTNQATINPLDITQWDFYVISARALDKKVGDQKTISLKGLKAIDIKTCEYEQLKEKIIEAYEDTT